MISHMLKLFTAQNAQRGTTAAGGNTAVQIKPNSKASYGQKKGWCIEDNRTEEDQKKPTKEVFFKDKRTQKAVDW